MNENNNKIEKFIINDENKEKDKDKEKEKEEDKNEKKLCASCYFKKSKIEIDLVVYLLQIFSFCPSILIFIYSNQIYFDGDVTRAIAIDLYDNLNTGYFSDFSDCSNSNEFNFLFDKDKISKQPKENDSNEIPFPFGKWQGTIQARKSINNKIRILEPGKTCSETELLIDKIPPLQLYKYLGLKLCYLTDITLNYYDLLKKPGTIISQDE